MKIGTHSQIMKGLVTSLFLMSAKKVNVQKIKVK